MILVLAGTRDGREIAEHSMRFGPVLATAATAYGGQLLAASGVEAITARMQAKQIVELCRQRDVRLIIDATHPFAVQISRQAMRAARRLGVDYIRFERERLPYDRIGCRVIEADDVQQAAEDAAAFDRIFLAVGTRHLEAMLSALPGETKRVVVRLLPDRDSVGKAQELGLTPQQIVALQGPFSRELNRALFTHYGVDVLVTKASGRTGGLDTKLEAAADLGLPVVLIKRPALDYPVVVHTPGDLDALLTERAGG